MSRDAIGVMHFDCQKFTCAPPRGNAAPAIYPHRKRSICSVDLIDMRLADYQVSSQFGGLFHAQRQN